MRLCLWHSCVPIRPLESTDIMPEDFWIRNDLIQEFCVSQYGIVNFVKFLFITKTLQYLEIGRGKRVEVFSTPMVCGGLI